MLKVAVPAMTAYPMAFAKKREMRLKRKQSSTEILRTLSFGTGLQELYLIEGEKAESRTKSGIATEK